MTAVDAVVFDLDDTLFPERDYAFSGLAAVAQAFPDELGDPAASLPAMCRLFDTEHRSRIFNQRLAERGRSADAKLIQQMIEAYRAHRPILRLHDDADRCLSRLRGRVKLGLITDGPAAVQRAKIEALCLEPRMDAVILTDELGAGMGKPHTMSFERIAESLAVAASRCIYVADNPAKDFLAPNRLGWGTVRIVRSDGIYRDQHPPSGGSAQRRIDTLDQLDALLT
jgi:putative hydrolase of the HAD superfamily